VSVIACYFKLVLQTFAPPFTNIPALQLQGWQDGKNCKFVAGTSGEGDEVRILLSIFVLEQALVS
jgi:hypothetical protein